MTRLRMVSRDKIKQTTCEKCGRRRPIFKNGSEWCGACYGIERGYFADPENDPAIRETFESGWKNDFSLGDA